MSEYAEAHRKSMKEKARRLAGGKIDGAVDASGWKPESETEPLHTESQTGMKPVSPRTYKKGGKVDGKEAHHHAGRAKRKSGGALTADSLINRNAKEANRERPGGNDHVGGLKKGGRAEGGSLGTPSKRPATYEPASNTPEPRYDARAVNNAIASSNRAGKRIGGKEAKLIHGLLKGRTGRAGGGPLGGENAITGPLQAAAAANATQNWGGVAPQRMSFGQGPAGILHVKKGGRVEHPDEREDRVLVDKMVKKSALTGKKDGGGNWISGAIKHPGALHKELHVPAGEKIPEKKLKKAEHAGGVEGKRARLAETLKHLPHRASGGEVEARLETVRRAMGPGPHETGWEALQRMADTKKEPVSTGREEGTRPTGGREARAHGGRAGKGKMNVNIIIAQPGHHDASMQPPGPSGPPPGAPPTAPAPQQQPPMGAMPVMPVGMPGGAPGGAPPAGMGARPPGMQPQMRKAGGRIYPIEDGAGGGEGRLEKIRAYGKGAYPD